MNKIMRKSIFMLMTSWIGKVQSITNTSLLSCFAFLLASSLKLQSNRCGPSFFSTTCHFGESLLMETWFLFIKLWNWTFYRWSWRWDLDLSSCIHQQTPSASTLTTTVVEQLRSSLDSNSHRQELKKICDSISQGLHSPNGSYTSP